MKIKERPPGLYSPSGKLLFESPPEAAIAKLIQSNHRITYFPYRLPEDGLPPIDEDPTGLYFVANTQGLARNLFTWDIVIPSLEVYLVQKYQGQAIVLRGIACSLDLDKPTVITNQTILNPIEIIQRGGEGVYDEPGKEKLPEALIFDVNHPDIPHRSLQWLLQWPEELRKRAAANGDNPAGKIFPLLLVYDRQTVRDHPSDPSKWIAEAIILDYPLTRKEYAGQDY